MKLEDQVCSLEYARKLKGLGVKQESLYYWVKYLDDPCNAIRGRRECMDLLPSIELCGDIIIKEQYSAFTVAELGEMLPNSVYGAKATDGKKWVCGTSFYERLMYEHDLNWRNHKDFIDTEADARAKMLIYLIENKLLKVEDINKKV